MSSRAAAAQQVRSHVSEVEHQGTADASLYAEILFTEAEVDARIAEMAV